MAQIYPTFGRNYDFSSTSAVVPKANKYDYAETAYTIFAFVITVLLIGLGMRAIFALLYIGAPFARGLTIFTQPVVAPFTHIFHDSHTMLQGSTAAAFSVYYTIYWIISVVSRFMRHPQAYSEN